MFNSIFRRGFITAFSTVILDFLFHYFLTKPMEILTYFTIKFLLSFFIATGMFSLIVFRKKIKFVIIISGLVFSTLMSTYYRAWELFEAYAPFGSRAPDILGISRNNLILFSGTWWLAHALFFVIGAFITIKSVKN